MLTVDRNKLNFFSWISSYRRFQCCCWSKIILIYCIINNKNIFGNNHFRDWHVFAFELVCILQLFYIFQRSMDFYRFHLEFYKHHSTYKICPRRYQQAYILTLDLPTVWLWGSHFDSAFHLCILYTGAINLVILIFYHCYNEFFKTLVLNTETLKNIKLSVEMVLAFKK